jgi:hypothetical protein
MQRSLVPVRLLVATLSTPSSSELIYQVRVLGFGGFYKCAYNFGVWDMKLYEGITDEGYLLAAYKGSFSSQGLLGEIMKISEGGWTFLSSQDTQFCSLFGQTFQVCRQPCHTHSQSTCLTEQQSRTHKL